MSSIRINNNWKLPKNAHYQATIPFSLPWPRWSDIWLLINSNGSRAGSGCVCLIPVCGWLEWPSNHQEWLGSTSTNRHGVTALDFATVSGCDQLVIAPFHTCGGTLDLLMTDVPDLIRVAVVAPLGRSDHSSLSIGISVAQAIPNLCVSKRVLLKRRVN